MDILLADGANTGSLVNVWRCTSPSVKARASPKVPAGGSEGIGNWAGAFSCFVGKVRADNGGETVGALTKLVWTQAKTMTKTGRVGIALIRDVRKHHTRVAPLASPSPGDILKKQVLISVHSFSFSSRLPLSFFRNWFQPSFHPKIFLRLRKGGIPWT